MPTATRNTKYSRAVLAEMLQRGHATNGELLTEIRKTYPDVSATTIHRVTSRLAEQGTLALAPRDKQGNYRYDANTKFHHHFSCQQCGEIRDITLKPAITYWLEEALGGCKLDGQLLIIGSCNKCK